MVAWRFAFEEMALLGRAAKGCGGFLVYFLTAALAVLLISAFGAVIERFISWAFWVETVVER